MSSLAGTGRGLLESLTSMAATASNYTGTPVTGTGLKEIIKFGRAAGVLTPLTIHAVAPELSSLFGGYPDNDSQERGPDALFIALFGLLFLVYLGMWVYNTSRRHNFHLFLGIAFYALMKVIGFACRYAWSYDISRLNDGICSVTFIQVAPLVLLSQNMVLGHRIFTWRHPEIGRHWSVVLYLDSVYFLVIGIIVMAIVGQAIPYLYFLEHHHYVLCLNVMKAAAVFNLIYAFVPLQFLALAYYMPAGRLLYVTRLLNKITGKPNVVPTVYQPTWIRSAWLFYYPAKNSQIPLYKGEQGSDSIRIIASREPPGHESLGPKMHPDAPHMHWATLTVLTTSLLLMLNICFRVAAVFRNDQWGTLVNGDEWQVNHWVDKSYVMFIFYGGVEIVVLVIYLLMRIDLRFYIPDRPSKRPANDTQQRPWVENPDLEKSYASHLSKSSNDVTTPATEDVNLQA